jgi:IS30 family transposase
LRPKRCKLAEGADLASVVADKLRLLWSPEEITAWLGQTYPHDETQQVSHETICRSLFIQARGALKKEILQHLRRTRGMRRGRHHTQKTTERFPKQCRSVNGRPRSKIERCQVTGKAIWSSAVAAARSPRSWNARGGTSCRSDQPASPRPAVSDFVDREHLAGGPVDPGQPQP